MIVAEFGRPQDGWMPVSLQTGNSRLAIDASYVPCDSVADLANALALILKGGPEATVSWNEEPIRYDFRFSQSRDGVHVVVMRLRGSGRPSNGGDELLSERGTALDIVRSFWR